MNDKEVRVRFSELTYKRLKALSVIIGIPVTKVVKNIVVNKLIDMKEGKK